MENSFYTHEHVVCTESAIIIILNLLGAQSQKFHLQRLQMGSRDALAGGDAGDDARDDARDDEGWGDDVRAGVESAGAGGDGRDDDWDDNDVNDAVSLGSAGARGVATAEKS